jgi:formylglycine-generating enzyme required for sulfatase activity
MDLLNWSLIQEIYGTAFVPLYLLWLGAGWFLLGIWHLWSRRNINNSILLVLAALVTWALIVLLTTNMVWTRELVDIDKIWLFKTGLPHYTALVVAVLITLFTGLILKWSLSSRVIVLALMLLLPVGLSLYFSNNARQTLTSVNTDLTQYTLAVPPPARPLITVDHPGMLLVPSGPFIRGSLNPLQLQAIVGNQEGDEQPVRSIYLDAFYIDQMEVTNSEFARFVEATGFVTDAETGGGGLIWTGDGWQTQVGAQWRFPAGPADSIEGKEQHPVVQVSWYDAQAYCQWTDKRLPTEAEWEKAARGSDGREFPWGNEFDPKRTNYCDRECTDLPQHKDNSASDGFSRTSPVGSYPTGASPYGVQDMAGNVWEWVQDWYDPYYYEYSPAMNPLGPTQQQSYYETKVVRGGSWTSEYGYVRTTSRSYDPPRDWRSFGVGFRCTQTLE